MQSNIKINEKIIGDGFPTYIIAEMSANHSGSIENAKEIIRIAKQSGADCVKLQTYTPDTITINCDNKYFFIDNGTWKGDYLYQLYQKAYTPWEWHQELFEEAKKVGIDIFSTPFDVTATDFLEELGVCFYKIASFEIVDIPLIKYVASKGKPIIMSTGMATYEEIREAVQAVYSTGNNSLALLKCSSSYPAISSDMNLITIKDMKEKLNIPIGLSDHSMGSLGAVVAVSLGANIIEKHLGLGEDSDNPDAKFSMSPKEFENMVREVRNAELAIGNVRYGASGDEVNNLRFRRSLFFVESLKAGEIVTQDKVKSIRPSDGILPKYIDQIIGKRVVRDVDMGTPVSWELFLEDDTK